MLQQLVNGLILGSVYALLALGYTMVYGIIKLINFAHGDIYMMGAFMGYFLINSLSIGFKVNISITAAFIPSFSNFSAVFKASATIIPFAIKVISEPSFNKFPFPISKVEPFS